MKPGGIYYPGNINVAVIGCGKWGTNLIRVFHELSDSNLVACCNLSNEGRLCKLKEQYPRIKVTQNLDNILDDQNITAVVIATPDNTHFDIGMKALKANKHTFVEKPLATSFQQTLELVKVAKKKGKVLMVGHIMQYHPAIKKIKERILNSKLKSIQSTRLDLGGIKPNGNNVWSSIIHDVSIIHYLLECAPQTVSAIGTCLNDVKFCDIIFVNLSFPNRVIANIYYSSINPSKERKLIIHCDEEIMTFDNITERLVTYSKENVCANIIEGQNYGYLFSEGKELIIDRGEPLKIECQDFLDSINDSTTPLSSCEKVLGVMKILETIEKSIQSENFSDPYNLMG
jgi:UDP-2-acetamido-3-amino-2,3-dideoxy-glucuronate N-acetyltransferase